LIRLRNDQSSEARLNPKVNQKQIRSGSRKQWGFFKPPSVICINPLIAQTFLCPNPRPPIRGARTTCAKKRMKSEKADMLDANSGSEATIIRLPTHVPDFFRTM
jgi:hypothetical protein